MGRSCTSRVLLLFFLMFVFSNNGFGRKLVDMPIRTDHTIAASELNGKSREMFELDYADAGPNFNGRSVYPVPSVPQPSPPPPPPPPPLTPSESG